MPSEEVKLVSTVYEGRECISVLSFVNDRIQRQYVLDGSSAVSVLLFEGCEVHVNFFVGNDESLRRSAGPEAQLDDPSELHRPRTYPVSDKFSNCPIYAP